MSKPKPPTRADFDKRFPDDDACLEHLLRTRYGERFHCPKCEKEARYYRIKGRRAYECEHCANFVYPTAGTPFDRTRTSLKDWFFVMFLFCASRNGVAAKEVQRQLGVTYKTAWRMCHLIRLYMGYVDGDFPVGGTGSHHGAVEIDETFVGGPDKMGKDDKHVVLGMIERGGDLVTRAVPSRARWIVLPIVQEFVRPGAKVMTDQMSAYRSLKTEFNASAVNHKRKEWTRGEVHTQHIDSFWNILKRGIRGTYITVSSRHLQKYLWEFEFRHNLRRYPHLMVETLLMSFPKEV
jgi:transposase-like protein